MDFRFLIGPVSAEWIDEFFAVQRERGECRCFNSRAPADFVLTPGIGWNELEQQFPPDWQPDVVILYPQYRSVPAAIWSAPVPIIALAGDWNLQWHAYRRALRHCDLVLTDTHRVETMRRAGIEHVRVMNLYGLGRSWTEFAWSDTNRDIDVLFVGNANAAVQRERMPWLARLCELRPKWNVVIASGVFGDDYRHLLARTRIVFNRGIRGECNCRVAEAIAGGALLFQDAGNTEVPMLLQDREECVFYDEKTLTQLLTFYLENEGERQRIAANARRKLQPFTFAHQWEVQATELRAELPALRERAERRRITESRLDLTALTWVQLSSSFGPDALLEKDIAHGIQERPRNASLLNIAGVLAVSSHELPGIAAHAANLFQEAWLADPRHVIAGLNLAEMLIVMGQRHHADEQSRRTLAMLDEIGDLSADYLDAPHASIGFDEFRVEWESAAWKWAGQPDREAQAKSILLRWRLHGLLAQINSDAVHAFKACALRPDLPSSHAQLGSLLARTGRVHDAIPYLQKGAALNPFDPIAARACYEALIQTGQVAHAQRLALARRRLAESAPALAPVEPWFTETAAVGVARDAISPLRIAWHGEFEVTHSLALVNREIAARLAERGHELSLMPARFRAPPGGQSTPLPNILQSRSNKRPDRADVHIAHQWPPDFTPPRDGHWIIIQPWEFGSVPKAWIEPMSTLVDEIWVPSRFVRDCFVRSGIPAHQVHVVPNGVSDVFLQGRHAPLPLRTRKRFKFLFVGGTIHRKGIDVLLKTYTQVFSDADDVCLIVKDMGVGTFYQGLTAEQQIAQCRQIPHAPEFEYIDRELSANEMASLYATCDCLVHPYRGEGFGLPIAEAMACGLPVVVTGYGAALDFCRDEFSYLLPAAVAYLPTNAVGDTETVDRPWLAEPDQDFLRYRLRYVFEHSEEARAKGKRAREFIADHFTWDHAVAVAERRLHELRQKPIRRLSQRIAVTPAPNMSATLVAAMPVARPKTSLAMIVKNEEHNLAACLQSVADLVEEIVIVDTGSTDRTKAIALERGAKVFDFPWIDSFSAARNESLHHSTGEWIFWMDADDRLDEENRAKLRDLIAGLPQKNTAFVMKCLCLPDAETGTATVVDHIRLFRNDPRIRWTYRIHEQILPAIRRLGGEVQWSDIVIHHVGYLDANVRKRKVERDLRLLNMEYREQPDEPFTLFNLASVYQEQGKIVEALDYFRRSLEHSAPQDSIVRKLHSQIIQCHRHLKQTKAALAACDTARIYYPDDREILFQEGLTRREVGDRGSAIACLERLLNHQDLPHFASVDTGLFGYKTRHNLAVFYQEDGRLDDAEKQWRLAADEQPNFLPALCGIVEVQLTRRNWTDFEHWLARIRATNKGEVEAQTFVARKHLALREFASARAAIAQAIASNPNAIWPRVVLTHVLLQEAVDWRAAEKALRDVLAIDPNHAEARGNLDVLLRQKGKSIPE